MLNIHEIEIIYWSFMPLNVMVNLGRSGTPHGELGWWLGRIGTSVFFLLLNVLEQTDRCSGREKFSKLVIKLHIIILKGDVKEGLAENWRRSLQLVVLCWFK